MPYLGKEHGVVPASKIRQMLATHRCTDKCCFEVRAILVPKETQAKYPGVPGEVPPATIRLATDPAGDLRLMTFDLMGNCPVLASFYGPQSDDPSDIGSAADPAAN